jgi:hypothetical protein
MAAALRSGEKAINLRRAGGLRVASRATEIDGASAFMMWAPVPRLDSGLGLGECLA